jgi:predicted dienelactone hydrolase
MRTLLIAVFVCCTALNGARAAGFQIVSVPDPGNPPIELGIWYPSDAAGKPEQLFLDTQTVAIGAPVAGHNLPLIMMSHGQGGRFANHYDTALALAAAGFVAAALTHTGDNLHDQSRVLAIQDRSRQLRVVTDYMLHAWPIDPNRIGVFGFSAGGFTALVAAGGVPDLSKLPTHCAQAPAEFTCALIARNHADITHLPVVPASAWIHDPRIKAAVVAAPALGFTFGKSGLAGLRVPVQLWRAERDHVLPQPFYAQAVKDDLPTPPEYHVVAHADHLDFLSPCDAEKARIVAIICQSPAGFDRAAFHATFNAAVVAFFRRTLGGG